MTLKASSFRQLRRRPRTRPALWISMTLVLALFQGPAAARAHEPGEDETGRIVRVVGRGEAESPPDIAEITFAIETTARTALEATEQNRTRSDRVVTSVKKLIGQEGRVTTTGFRVRPLYEEPEPGVRRPAAPRERVGYRAENEIRVRLSDLPGTGALIDAAVGAGADRVSDLRFDVRDRRQLMQQAIASAGKDATAQARAAAEALGIRLGPVRSVSTASEPILFPRTTSVALAASRTPTPVEPGTVKLSASVSVVFEIAE